MRRSAVGLNRKEAAAWISRRVRYSVTEVTLRFWERHHLLLAQRPGHRIPAVYGVPELIAACVVAELRKNRAPLRRARRAFQNLRKFLPDIAARPGSWHLAVTGSGDVVHLSRDGDLLELTRRPGQVVLSLLVLEAGTYAQAARDRLERIAA
jgi:hypothetical protein